MAEAMKELFLQAKLPVSFFKEGKSFIAYTPALDLSTSGKNFEEVKRRFNEIVAIFFEEIIEKGTVNEVLLELGWKKKDEHWSPPIPIGHETEEIKIPLRK